MQHSVHTPIGGKDLIIETGKLAKQADGAVTVQLGDTIVIVAAVAATRAREGQEFFPLTVDYREKAAAAGRFPGGYFKREGRPTEKEILTSRMIDRPIRPLFPRGWFNEVQVQSILLSADGENDPDMLSIVGASAALLVSDVPWGGPLGAVRVGRANGQFVANPTHEQMTGSDIDLVYVGNETELVMFEGSAKEISEADFNAALKFGHEAIQPLIAAQKELAQRVGVKKREIQTFIVPDEILNEPDRWQNLFQGLLACRDAHRVRIRTPMACPVVPACEYTVYGQFGLSCSRCCSTSRQGPRRALHCPGQTLEETIYHGSKVSRPPLRCKLCDDQCRPPYR